jgi:RsiW-degrading membrane proteinase PrsW (M82 family)
MSRAAPSIAPTWHERGSILRPRLPAFWLFAFLLTTGALGVGGIVAERVSANQEASLLAIALLFVWAIPLVLVIHSLDLFEREPLGMLAAAFAWGGLAAVTLAIPANTALLDLIAKLGSRELAADWGAAIAGPTNEETLKALGLLLLVLIAGAEIDTPIDGLVYGAFVGLGFQVVENFLYFTNPAFAGNGYEQTRVVWDLFVIRGLVDGVWSHAAYTGLVGLGIGYAVSRPDVPLARRVAVAVLAFAGAWAMHFAWNAPWLTDLVSTGLRGWIAFSVLKGLPGGLLLVALYLLARRGEARWVEQVLAPEVETGAVTPEEIAALLTFHGRRRARRAARKAGGRAAARLVKQLQREQVAFAVELTRTAGAETREIQRRRAAIASIRAALRSLQSRQSASATSRR